MKLDYSPRFEHVLDSLKRQYNAYQDGFIMENEETLHKWLKSTMETIVEMGDIRRAVALQYYHEKLENETANRIDEIKKELND